MAKIFIEGRRDGYTPEQCGRTMTVGELIAYLENFDEDAKIYLENDGGYTYGYITKGSFREVEDEDEDTDAEDDYETMEPEEFLKKHIDD
jgi:hypothetical protein